MLEPPKKHFWIGIGFDHDTRIDGEDLGGHSIAWIENGLLTRMLCQDTEVGQPLFRILLKELDLNGAIVESHVLLHPCILQTISVDLGNSNRIVLSKDIKKTVVLVGRIEEIRNACDDIALDVAGFIASLQTKTTIMDTPFWTPRIPYPPERCAILPRTPPHNLDSMSTAGELGIVLGCIDAARDWIKVVEIIKQIHDGGDGTKPVNIVPNGGIKILLVLNLIDETTIEMTERDAQHLIVINRMIPAELLIIAYDVAATPCGIGLIQKKEKVIGTNGVCRGGIQKRRSAIEPKIEQLVLQFEGIHELVGKTTIERRSAGIKIAPRGDEIITTTLELGFIKSIQTLNQLLIRLIVIGFDDIGGKKILVKGTEQ